MDHLLQDARYALRLLRKTPGFALAAVLALALGIGANSAVFSVVNGVLLRPLPSSVLEYRDYQERSHTLASVAAYANAGVTLTGQDTPERLRAVLSSASLFSTLGVSPVMGRGFSQEEKTQDMARLSADVVASSEGYGTMGGWMNSVVSMEEQTVGAVRSTLWVLLGAVAFVLLSACTNVANLLLARAAARSREISIRAALGARQVDVLGLMVGQGLRLALLGVGIGLLLSLGLGRLLSALLYGVQAHAPLIFAGVAVLLALVALVASWLPARRAAKVDPALTLRAE